MKDNKCINPIKTEVRLETIIKPYRHYFNKKLPEDKQYWTLCNVQNHLPNSEIIQLVNSDIITTEQYCGVDIDDRIIKDNKKQFPTANWRQGDFYYSLLGCNNFNPGIIYYDSTGGIGKEKENIGYILNLLYERNITDVLVVFNLIMKHRIIDDSEKDIMRILESDELIQDVLLNDNKLDYSFNPMMYNSGNTDMFTLQFIR